MDDENYTLKISNFDSIKKYAEPIILDDIVTLKQQILSANKNDIDNMYRICIYLRKYNIIDFLIQKKYIPPFDVLYNVIKTNDIECIKKLIEVAKIDIMDKNGLTPIEYAISLYKDGTDNKEMILLLNNYKYARNPKWFDYMCHTKIYSINPKNDYELSMIRDIENINDLIELNNCIVKNMMKEKMIVELKIFISHYIKFIDIDKMLNIIRKQRFVEIFENIDNIIQLSIELVKTYFEFQMYEKILKIKDKLDINPILLYLIQICDVNGLVFMFEYIDKNIVKNIFDKGNTLMHILCSQQNECSGTFGNAEYCTTQRILKCAKVLITYYPEIVTIQNENGDVPIFISCNNIHLDEFLSEYIDIDILNSIGDTYLHNIIRNGSNEVLIKSMSHKNISDLINTLNKNGDTPLILACKLRKQEMCNILINYKADVTIPDKYGNTCEHFICLYGLCNVHIDNIKETKNMYDNTPLDYIICYLCDKLDLNDIEV